MISDLALLKNGGISVGNARWIEAKSPGDSLSVGLVALRGTDDARFCRRGVSFRQGCVKRRYNPKQDYRRLD
jgi:hypothetical protein